MTTRCRSPTATATSGSGATSTRLSSAAAERVSPPKAPPVRARRRNARHPRCYGREDMVFDPIHYLPLLEQKIGALDQAAPLADWDLPPEFQTLRRLMEARLLKAGRRGVRPGPAAPRDLRAGRPARGGEDRPADGCRRPRRDQAPFAMAARTGGAPWLTHARSRSGHRGSTSMCIPTCRVPMSGRPPPPAICASSAARHERRARSCCSTIISRTLKLPTFLREYAKLARQCAAEGQDHVQFLARLVELELIDRERRMIERRSKAAKFPVTKSLDSFDFKAIPSLNKMQVLELATLRVDPSPRERHRPRPERHGQDPCLLSPSVSPPARRACPSASPPPLHSFTS